MLLRKDIEKIKRMTTYEQYIKHYKQWKKAKAEHKGATK
ncbi:hypothetical protein EV207_10636 [Scopulibacillus darangshiensis]|uniref:Uncharacterized protein n=1 Tax=Scopulibacillus darangshiensis TaxID=442528 RepID=A0A4R2P5X2_9BACL|nr:hypothetical protein EV207_10636 [Scopulibacillus darangshiensis]